MSGEHDWRVVFFVRIHRFGRLFASSHKLFRLLEPLGFVFFHLTEQFFQNINGEVVAFGELSDATDGQVHLVEPVHEVTHQVDLAVNARLEHLEGQVESLVAECINFARHDYCPGQFRKKRFWRMYWRQKRTFIRVASLTSQTCQAEV